MRIIKGRFGRRLIHPPAGLAVRPSTDLGKESLFNILENRLDFEQTHALDLFSGTGNISFELVSRGCPSVTSIEKDMRCIRFISKTAKEFHMPELKLIKADVFRFLANHRQAYELIFADPPFEMPQSDYEHMIQIIRERGLLAEGGTLVIEHSKRIELTHLPWLVELRKYGKASV